MKSSIFLQATLNLELTLCFMIATDLFIQLVGLHSGFRLHNNSSTTAGPLKESHLSGFCGANSSYCNDPLLTKSFLACPGLISSRTDYESCMEHISKNNFSLPKYSIFAAPTSIFEDSVLAPNFLLLHEKTSSSPLFIILLREPLSSIVSLWTHWNRFTDGTFCTVPLSEVLEAELRAYRNPGTSQILNEIVDILRSGSMTFYSLARLVALRNEMTSSFEAAMLTGKCQNNQTCMQRYCYANGGFIFKSLISLHILGWIHQFPPMRGNLLIVNYTYYFKNRPLFLLNRMMQFFYRDRSQFASDAEMILRNKEVESQLLEKKASWHTPDRLDKKPNLSEDLKNRVQSFLRYADPNIRRLLFRLQQEKVAVIEPKMWRATISIQSKRASWWFNTITNTTLDDYVPPQISATNSNLTENSTQKFTEIIGFYNISLNISYANNNTN